MNFIVKNTTKSNILDVICPYYCRGCGCVGEALCKCCKKNILASQKDDFLDKNDDLPFRKVWFCGWKDELLGRLVREFKFNSARRMGKILADISCQTIDDLSNVVVVPLPTIRRHVRERGMDHTMIVAKKIAQQRGWRVERILERVQNNVQVGSDAKTREAQAKQAYRLAQEIVPNQNYLLFDDVWTTGASMCEAAKILQRNGAKNIFGLILVKNRRKLFGDALNASLDGVSIDTDGIKNEVYDRKGKD